MFWQTSLIWLTEKADLEPHADVEEDHDGHGDDEEEQRRRLEVERRRVEDPAVRRLRQRLERKERWMQSRVARWL